MDKDKFFISSNPKLSLYVYQGLCKAIPNCQNLHTLHLIDQKLGGSTWKLLGSSLSLNSRILSVQITGCNISKHMKPFIEELSNNTSINCLNLSDNELSDSAGTIVLGMIKKLSEMRNNEIWTKGLRQSSSKRNIV